MYWSTRLSLNLLNCSSCHHILQELPCELRFFLVIVWLPSVIFILYFCTLVCLNSSSLLKMLTVFNSNHLNELLLHNDYYCLVRLFSFPNMILSVIHICMWWSRRGGTSLSSMYQFLFGNSISHRRDPVGNKKKRKKGKSYWHCGAYWSRCLPFWIVDFLLTSNQVLATARLQHHRLNTVIAVSWFPAQPF